MSLTDMQGWRFGRLTIVKRKGSDGFRRAAWLCTCDCGTLKVVPGCDLRQGKILSCGCLSRHNSRMRLSQYNFTKKNKDVPNAEATQVRGPAAVRSQAARLPKRSAASAQG